MHAERCWTQQHERDAWSSEWKAQVRALNPSRHDRFFLKLIGSIATCHALIFFRAEIAGEPIVMGKGVN